MAAKSDLAQKLLHDLRLRKERMAAAQNYGNSHSAAKGGYANAGQPHRGSRQIKTLESAGSRTRNSQTSGRSNRSSFNAQESSGQIVPYGAGRKIDLSMAITFAIENRGKFTKLNSSVNNSVLGFIHQIGQTSLDLGKMERRSPSRSQFVTLSNVQVSEISKGVQKINQILKACSDGVNFDRYSVEVGKELLKGAMDLESSLRMLVKLQETSNYMVTPQRKNRIMLLDEDEDEDEDNSAETADQKLQLDLPRFSFDKPPRKSFSKKETSGNRLLALTYPENKTLTPNENKPLSPSHRRSTSIQDSKALSATLEPEKGRISNVIAKLMGLDELPQNASRQSTSKKKDGPEFKKAAHSSIRLTADSENKPPHSIDKKSKQIKNMLPSPDAIFSLKDEKAFLSPNGGSDTISHQREVKQAVKHQSNISQIHQLPGNLLKNEREPPNNDNGGSETVSKNEAQQKLPQKHKMEVTENLSPLIAKHRKNTHQTENKVTDRLLLEQNPLEKTEASRLQKPRNSDGMEDKHQPNSTKQKLEARKPNGSQVETRISQTVRNKTGSVQKRQPSLNQAQNGKNGSKNPTFARPQKDISNTMQNVDKIASPEVLTPRIQKVVQEKPIKVPVIKKKESYIQIHRREATKSIDRSDGRKGSPKPMAASLKQQLPILQVKKQPKRNVNSTSAKEGKLTEDNSKELKGNISESKTSENPPGQKEIYRQIPEQKNDSFASEQHEPLTESEKHLKETLIKSHEFLSTSEALLKLNLPISVLHGTDHINQDADFKLTVDCGYEVMRRKARRQELSLHPCAKISISYSKVRSLDDLIKQLCKDFEKLKSYGWNGRESSDSMQYFNNMLVKDMQNRDPDINCMWDFGWDDAMFGLFLEKDDIAKDVEKHLLRGLIDEITIDLL